MSFYDQIWSFCKVYAAMLRFLVGVLLLAGSMAYGRKMWLASRNELAGISLKGGNLSQTVFQRNVEWARKWIIELGLVFGALACFGEFKSEYTFPVSHIDGIIAMMSVIGIIGALWALFARIDAEKAFLKAQETLDALGNSFNFSEIFYQNRIPSVLNAIAEENKKVSLFLGFPCIACFYSHRDKIQGGDKKIRDTFIKFTDSLRKIARDIDSDDTKPYAFNLAIFSIREMEATAAESDFIFSSGGDELLANYKRALRSIIEEKRKKPVWDEMIKIHIMDKLKEKFRFAILNDTTDSSASKAIIWIVPDFPSKKNGFESACFQTRDLNLVAMLEKVFDKATDDSECLLKELRPDL
jgi:hypothetical protein